MLAAAGLIDLIIPRGGKSLVRRVQAEARVPVLAHAEGLCHTYIHASAELGMARMLQKQGKRAEAISVYNDFLVQHPYAPERTGVMETLAQLGVAADTQAPIVKIIKPASVPTK